MQIYTISLALIYIFYITFESLAGLARFGGFKVGFISVGLSLQNQILSMNRLLGFFIAPMVGFFADRGGSASEIFYIGLSGCICGGISLLTVYRNWSYITNMFSSISASLVSNGYNLKNILYGIKHKHKHKHTPKELPKLKFNYFFAQAFTTGLAMPSIFILNIIAIKTPNYSSTILQMTTVISGFGNLILNFYTYPMLSIEESKHDESDTESSYKSIFLGKIFGMLILSPTLMCSYFFI